MKDISVQLNDILQDYSKEVIETANECSLKVANEGAERLKETSPHRTGKYAKGWTVKEENKSFFGSVTYVICNKAKPYLTHLLENGHANRNGGRTEAREHIKPIEEWVQEELPQMIKQKLGGR